MNDVSGDVQKFLKKLYIDLFLEKDGKPNLENIAFVAAFLPFMVASWRVTLSGGHWDPLTFGLGCGAILIGGGAAIGSKRKTAAVLKRLESRIENLENHMKSVD